MAGLPIIQSDPDLLIVIILVPRTKATNLYPVDDINNLFATSWALFQWTVFFHFLRHITRF